MPALPDIDVGNMLLRARSNMALHTNPPVAPNNITTHGSDWLWAVTALMALLLLCTVAWTVVTPAHRRIFHYIAIGTLLISTIYYFIMASDLGDTAVQTEFRQGNIPGRTRQVYYTRWVGYFLNFSLLFFGTLLLSGVGWATIIFTTGLVMVWDIMLLIGSLVHTSYKWGFYVFALIAWFALLWQKLGVARSYASRFDPLTHRTYSTHAGYLLFFMMLYLINWGLSEGGNRISNDSENIFYGILDIFTQGIFPIMMIFMASKLDFDDLGLGYFDYGRVRGHRNGIHDEKRMHGGEHNGAGTTDGPATV